MLNNCKLIWLIFLLLFIFTNFEIPNFVLNFLKKLLFPTQNAENVDDQNSKNTKISTILNAMKEEGIVEIMEIRMNIDAIFQILDSNRDKMLSFMEWWTSIGIVDDESMIRFGHFDADSDGQLNSLEFFNEFLEEEFKRISPQKFKSLDKMPADGQISLGEFAKFKSLFGKTSKQQIETIFSTWDRNENGQLDEGEFAIFYTHQVIEQAILVGLINPNHPNIVDILRS